MKARFLFALLIFLMGCASSDEKKVRVAATPVPHAEMLELVKPAMKERGYRLEVVEVDDYNLPNRLLHEGRVDANFFQHQPFLDLQNREFGYRLVALKRIHIEPLGLYSTKIASLDTLCHGALVAIPSDPTNEARALSLLAHHGLVTLNENPLATTEDILENPKNLRFREVDAALLPRILPDVDAAVIPANFALHGGLSPQRDALALEATSSPYANILVVREGEGEREELQALAELLSSEEMTPYLQKRGLAPAD